MTFARCSFDGHIYSCPVFALILSSSGGIYPPIRWRSVRRRLGHPSVAVIARLHLPMGLSLLASQDGRVLEAAQPPYRIELDFRAHQHSPRLKRLPPCRQARLPYLTLLSKTTVLEITVTVHRHRTSTPLQNFPSPSQVPAPVTRHHQCHYLNPRYRSIVLN